MKAPGLTVEGIEIKVPSHADLVEGLTEHVDAQIASYDQSTVDAKIAHLSDVYLGINAKAKDSDKADYATTAGKATYDQEGGYAIHEKYYKKTDTVDKAAADDAGNNFRQKYARIDGSYPNMTVGNATNAGAALKATLDAANNNINSTYIKSIYNSGGTTTITFERGDGSKDTFLTKDTTYPIASADQSGLMSAAMYTKLSALSTDTSTQSVAHAVTADKLKNSRTIQISGGGSGSASFDGSANVNIALGSLNASSITSGTLAVARGGTGQTNLDNVTVGKAKAFDSARTVSFSGAVSGSASWSGNGNLSVVTNNIDVSKTTAGVLPTLNGGTGRTDGFAQGLAKAPYINGKQFDGAADIHFFGTCSSNSMALSDPNRTQLVATIPNFKLYEGVSVVILFSYPVMSGCTLNINGTGNIPIKMLNRTNEPLTGFNYSPVHLIYARDAWNVITRSVYSLYHSRTFSIANGVTANEVAFDGSANVTLNANSINASYINSGAVPIAFGGTGQTDGTVAKLHSARNINGIPFDGSGEISFHGTCDAAADEVDKIVNLPGYVSKAGNIILVRFSNPNTASSPTINVNGIGARPVKRGQYNTPVSNITRYNYQEVMLVDCSAYWRIVDNPTNLAVKLTGAVTGEASISNDAFTVATSFDPTVGMDSIDLTYSDPKVFDATTGLGDLNRLTDSGFYRVAMGNGDNWNHYPSTLVSNSSNVNQYVMYMQVFKSSSYSQSTIQMAFDMWGNQMYYRVRTQGTYKSWRKVSTTDVTAVSK